MAAISNTGVAQKYQDSFCGKIHKILDLIGDPYNTLFVLKHDPQHPYFQSIIQVNYLLMRFRSRLVTM
jgi:hypothetical protein